MRSKQATRVSSGRVCWPASVVACHMLQTRRARAGVLTRSEMRSHSRDSVRPQESVSREGRLRSDCRTANVRQMARAEAGTEIASQTRVNSARARVKDSRGPPPNLRAGVYYCEMLRMVYAAEGPVAWRSGRSATVEAWEEGEDAAAGEGEGAPELRGAGGGVGGGAGAGQGQVMK